MATHSVLIKRRNAANNGYDNILPVTTTENVLTEAGDISLRLDKSSFMAFCANVNADSLDAAFGKNNESNIGGLGYQLAMYAWFKGETGSFENLIKQNTLSQILNTPESFSEFSNTPSLLDIANSSPYAASELGRFIPSGKLTDVGLVIVDGHCGISGGLSGTGWQSLGSFSPKLPGAYVLSAMMLGYRNEQSHEWRILVNGEVIKTGSVTGGSNDNAYSYEIREEVVLTANDIVNVQLRPNYTYFATDAICLLAKYPTPSLIPNTTLGNIPIFRFTRHYGGSSNAITYTSGDNLFICQKEGTYRLSINGGGFGSSGQYTAQVNGVDIAGFPKDVHLNTNRKSVVTIDLNVGDIVRLGAKGSTTSGRGSYVQGSICSGDNPNKYPIP